MVLVDACKAAGKRLTRVRLLIFVALIVKLGHLLVAVTQV